VVNGPENLDSRDIRKADVQKNSVHTPFSNAMGRRIQPLGPLDPQLGAFVIFHHPLEVVGIGRVMLDQKQV
jgi:hypothetical protein